MPTPALLLAYTTPFTRRREPEYPYVKVDRSHDQFQITDPRVSWVGGGILTDPPRDSDFTDWGMNAPSAMPVDMFHHPAGMPDGGTAWTTDNFNPMLSHPSAKPVVNMTKWIPRGYQTPWRDRFNNDTYVTDKPQTTTYSRLLDRIRSYYHAGNS